MTSQEQQWTMTIQPRRHWFELNLHELWMSRELIYLFVRRDFVAQYKQTVLGPLWYIIQPLLTTITFTIIFGRIAQLPTDGTPDFIFYLSGTIIWGYFAGCINKTSTTFISNAGMFSKVYFPRLVTPISYAISQLINFGIQALFFLGFLLYFVYSGANVQPNRYILLMPLLLFLMAGLGLGMGIVISSMTTRYRDLRHLVTFGVQLLMYATPVIYPISAVPEAYQTYIYLNPMTAVVETFRYAFLGTGTISLGYLLYSFVFTIVLLIVGILLFNRVEATFLDTV